MTPSLLYLAILSGCTTGEVSQQDAPALTVSGDTGSPRADSASATTMKPTAADRVPIYWSIRGALVIDKAGVKVEPTSLQIDYWAEDLTLTCKDATDLVIDVVAPSPVPDKLDQPLNSWYTLTLGDSVATGVQCPGWAAGDLEIGFGVYDGSLNPALEARGYSEAGLFGLFVRDPAGQDEVYLVGVAGTDDMFKGVEIAATDLPPGPGTYRLHSLIVLDL